VGDQTQAVVQWQITATLCQDLAEAAIDLKTAGLGLSGAGELSPSRLRKSRDRALGIVLALEATMRAPRPLLSVGDVEMPPRFVAWLRTSPTRPPVSAAGLTRLRHHLCESRPAISADDVALLDALTAELDEQATALAHHVGELAGAQAR